MRLKARVDGNQVEIVTLFRSMGCSVQHLHVVGKGCPDILVGHKGLNLLIEIKDGALPSSAQRLTKGELDWHNAWQGQVCIIKNKTDVIDLIEKQK